MAAAERAGAGSAEAREEDQMSSMRTVMMTAAVVVALSAGWPAKTSSQPKAPASFLTDFSHEKVDASQASTGSTPLFARKDRQGRNVVHSVQQPRQSRRRQVAFT
jgi:hypothetical protein